MKEFTYSVHDPLGIHARPAGMLGKLCKTFADTTVMVVKDGKEAKATQPIKLIGLAVKNGDTVTVKADGPSEDAAIVELKKFFEEHL